MSKKPTRKQQPFVAYPPKENWPTPPDLMRLEVEGIDKKWPGGILDLSQTWTSVPLENFLSQGNPLAAIEAFERADRRGRYPDVRVLKWLAAGFRTYLASHGHLSLDQALGIKPKTNKGKRGRPSGTSAWDKRARKEIEEIFFREIFILHKGLGWPRTTAIETVREYFKGKDTWQEKARASLDPVGKDHGFKKFIFEFTTLERRFTDWLNSNSRSLAFLITDQKVLQHSKKRYGEEPSK